MSDEIIQSVSQYYTEKIKEHGVSPKGVDWNSTESQEIRFEQLMKIIDWDSNPSILDFGCGYGAMYEYIQQQGKKFRYKGYDISEEMIAKAKNRYGTFQNAEWGVLLTDNEKFDYIIASGVFNVKLENDQQKWLQYIQDTLRTLNMHSVKGFSFNILTSYSDAGYLRDYLYYGIPEDFFGFCKQNFSQYVALLHDYPLYEFTILIKKELWKKKS